ncbi:MAG: hypothetical protein ACRC46_04905 [Thermoguttaceae bacterium]
MDNIFLFSQMLLWTTLTSVMARNSLSTLCVNMSVKLGGGGQG